MRSRALILGAALAITSYSACFAIELKITRGGNANWTWTCAIGGHSGLRCGLQPVSAESIAITFNGVPQFSGPYISYSLPNPMQSAVLMHIDDQPEVEIAHYPPSATTQFVAMLHGNIMFISKREVAGNATTIKVDLNGLRQSYCDAIEYITEHGAQPPDNATSDIKLLTRCD